MKPMYQRKRGLLRVAAIGQVIIMAGAGCKSSSPKHETGINDVSVSQALVGRDLARTVTAANTVLNGYAALDSNAAANATSIKVTNLNDFKKGTPPRPALEAGDLVLIIQMAGAAIDPNDTVDYGKVTNLNNAGRYEFAGVVGTNTGDNTITLGCGLKHSYTAAGKTQVVRVPQYTNLTINSGASITADSWDGTVGGVVAIHAMNTITVTGEIDVSGKGFRGGNTHQGADSSNDVALYTSANAQQGAMKGEGIAGDPNDAGFNTQYGSYGRGAPANGGGGGNQHNAGGGGGANAAATETWTGQGVMLSSVVGSAAWTKETTPAANSSGGGRGGYTWSSNNEDALAVGPDQAAWSGNNRRQRGGLGGRPLTSSTGGAEARLFMGGGGGAGDGNNLVGGSVVAGPGGAGGGLVFLIAGTVTGAGTIAADGAKGGDVSLTGNADSDGAGGGGGGGTIVVHAGVLSDVKVSAKGGVGGSQIFSDTTGTEAEGTGGGGGGGFIALSGGTLTSVSADGALGGTTNSGAMTEFPSNGATAGHAGITNASANALMYCTDHAAPDAIIITKPSNPSNVAAPVFTFGGVEANSAVDAGDSSASFVCSLDGAAFTSCPPTYIVPNLPEGEHTMRVRAVDLSGNDAGVGSEDVYTWRVDLTAPIARIVTGPGGTASGGTTTSRNADFTLSATELDGGTDGEIITFLCRLDSDTGAFAQCNGTGAAVASYTGLTDGITHTLDVRARDNAGNETAAANTVRWTWSVHALDAGEDGGEDDAGLDAALADAGGVDAAGTEILDARPDVTRDTIAVADRPVVQDTPAVYGDAARDGDDDDAGWSLLDAGSDVRSTDARASDARAVDATLPLDTTAVVPSPDAYTAPRDTAQPVVKLDAAELPTGDGLKLMGGGFCSLSPSGSGTPGLATLFLVAAFGMLIVRRRRR